jgi:hypothetical protein
VQWIDQNGVLLGNELAAFGSVHEFRRTLAAERGLRRLQL